MTVTHTIGEVLNRLKEEFEDVTISKIRFLEAEGLIQPDRTESGYRQFAPGDIERLRYILRAQRDRYLPLKVIKDELDRIDAGLPVDDSAPTPPSDAVAAVAARGSGGSPAPERSAPRVTAPPVTDVQLGFDELVDATGLEPRDLRGLQEHGLIRDEPPFDGDDLTAAKLASRLMDEGLEPRHLRMYRQFADREAALYEQLVSPLIKQRNPDSRRAATEQLDALSDAGRRLQQSVLARRLRELLRR